jgi:DNA-binding Xre family transcriptional regulator
MGRTLYRMRLRIRELLSERGMTPCKLARLSEGRISLSTLYRILRADGQAPTFESKLLDAICDVLGTGPNELLEREPVRRRKKG